MRAKVRRILNKKLRKEKASIESATRKRGLWASVGSSLGSLLAMAVTGGAAAPIVAGMLSGGLSYVGGTLGNFIARFINDLMHRFLFFRWSNEKLN